MINRINWLCLVVLAARTFLLAPVCVLAVLRFGFTRGLNNCGGMQTLLWHRLHRTALQASLPYVIRYWKQCALPHVLVRSVSICVAFQWIHWIDCQGKKLSNNNKCVPVRALCIRWNIGDLSSLEVGLCPMTAGIGSSRPPWPPSPGGSRYRRMMDGCLNNLVFIL